MRTETISLAAAVLLHAGLLAARFFVHVPSAESAKNEAIHTIDIDSLELPAVRPDRELAPMPPAAAAGSQPPSPAEARRPSASPIPGSPDPGPSEPAATPSAEATGNPVAPPGPSPDHYDSPPDDGRPGGVLGVPGLQGPVWAMPGVLPDAPRPSAAPTVAPAPRPVDKDIAGQVIREAMRTNDKALGIDMPGAGAVASTVGQAVYGSDAPDVGRATFEVRLSADGKVLGVRVASFNAGTADTWDRAAQAAAQLLRSKKLQMNESFSKGGTVYVDVSSVLQLPSGSTSVIKPSGLGAQFDVSDIGAHARRVVKTSFRAVAAR